MNSNGAIPNVIASEIAHELTSTNSVRVSRRPPRANPASAASSVPPSTVLTNTMWMKNVSTHSTWNSHGGPGSGAGSRAGIRLVGMARLRDVRRLQRQQVGGQGLLLRGGPHQGRHQRVIELVGRDVPLVRVRPRGVLVPLLAHRGQDPVEHVGIDRGHALPDREVAVDRVAGGALAAEK